MAGYATTTGRAARGRASPRPRARAIATAGSAPSRSRAVPVQPAHRQRLGYALVADRAQLAVERAPPSGPRRRKLRARLPATADTEPRPSSTARESARPPRCRPKSMPSRARRHESCPAGCASCRCAGRAIRCVTPDSSAPPSCDAPGDCDDRRAAVRHRSAAPCARPANSGSPAGPFYVAGRAARWRDVRADTVAAALGFIAPGRGARRLGGVPAGWPRRQVAAQMLAECCRWGARAPSDDASAWTGWSSWPSGWWSRPTPPACRCSRPGGRCRSRTTRSAPAPPSCCTCCASTAPARTPARRPGRAA